MKTDSDPRTTEELKAEATRLMVKSTQFLVEGIGDRAVSMTDATEAIYGSSGRGSPRAVRIIETLAEYGYVRIERSGRIRRVSLTDKGLACGRPPLI